MGWLFYTDPSRVQGYAGEKDEITRLTTHKTDEVCYKPLQISKVGSTWYGAVEKRSLTGTPITQKNYVAQADGRFVFGVIILVKYDQGCFGYKDMDECMGPGEARAPTSLLRKLSPLKDPTEDGDPNNYARQWRARCHAFASIPSYNIGDVITLGEPIALSGGAEVHEVRKSSYFYRGKNRSYYIDVVSGASFRLNRMHLSGSKLKTSAMCAGTDVLAEFTARQARGA